MKITAKQLSDIYYSNYNRATGAMLEPNHENPIWDGVVEDLNKITDLETCHELALAQNVAVGSIGTHVNGSYQNIYKSLYMKPAPPPLTRAELLRHLLDNESKGRELHHGLEFNYFEVIWSSIAEHYDIDLQHPENYRIIK